ncbi:MAG: hypothetical protein KJ667_07595 [Alphaproteobacteria bacterium]|nr:hypothetical protein [Alphaproteobacteria bacterium]
MTAERKTKTGLFIALAAGLILVLGVAAFALRGGDPVRDDAVRIATATLGVPVSIGSVSVEPGTGIVVVNNIKIANPPGFKNSHAMTITQMHLTAQGLGPQLLTFTEISVTGLVVNLEVMPEGTNLSALRRNMNAAASANEKTEAGAVLKTIIKRAEMADARLNPLVTLSGTEAQPITLPDMVLRGIGDRENGLILSDGVMQIADHVIRVASQAAGQAGFYRGMSPTALKAMQEQLGLTAGILETAVGIVKKDVQELTGGIKNLIQQNQQPAQPQPAPVPAQ